MPKKPKAIEPEVEPTTVKPEPPACQDCVHVTPWHERYVCNVLLPPFVSLKAARERVVHPYNCCALFKPK